MPVILLAISGCGPVQPLWVLEARESPLPPRSTTTFWIWHHGRGRGGACLDLANFRLFLLATAAIRPPPPKSSTMGDEGVGACLDPVDLRCLPTAAIIGPPPSGYGTIREEEGGAHLDPASTMVRALHYLHPAARSPPHTLPSGRRGSRRRGKRGSRQ